MNEMNQTNEHELRCRTVEVLRIRMRIREQGAGTPVILCHGFPGLGFSYRHQMAAIAQAGFRAVAPDMLGYGGTDAPDDPAEYTYERVAADLVALLDVLEAPCGVFVGHDFGAPSAWNVALRAPERTAALVLLSVPYDGELMPVKPSIAFANIAKKHFFHVHYFQERGPADRELSADPRAFLTRLFWALSGEYHYLDIWRHSSEGNGYLDVLPEAPPLPWSWLSVAELEHYVAEFTRTGFTGGLSWYRAFDRNWELSQSLAHAPIAAPTLFIAGARDAVVELSGEAAIAKMRARVPDLRGVHLLDGAGHFIQQERAAQVNERLLAFLSGLSL
jgi:pimeloyl-ACP methyl ester carboxylesterase